jgi:2-polyprenyl-6-methoxyphenol hydroxylase-like FAD-dependent oxidoreductase
LTLALQLHQRGISCEVWEAAEALLPLGVGINLLPHAVRELYELGLASELAAFGIQTSTLAYFNQFGQPIWSEPRGHAAGYDWPQFSVHRGEFQLSLAGMVLRRMGESCLQTGLKAEGFTPTETSVSVQLRGQGPDAPLIEKTADVVIAADGIHSVVRRLMHRNHPDPLRFCGRMLWRAVTEAEPYLDGKTMFMAGHQDQKFVVYPISESARQQGRSLINWIAELRVTPDSLQNDWNRKVPTSLFDHALANWKWDWIDIPSMIAAAEAVYEDEPAPFPQHQRTLARRPAPASDGQAVPVPGRLHVFKRRYRINNPTPCGFTRWRCAPSVAKRLDARHAPFACVDISVNHPIYRHFRGITGAGCMPLARERSAWLLPAWQAFHDGNTTPER